MIEAQGLPLYLQIKQALLKRVLSFTYRDRLPGELILADEFNVARGTIKQAIGELVNSGIVHKEHGKGSFINRAALYQHYKDLPEILVQQAYPKELEMEVVSLLPMMANYELAEQMNLPIGSQLILLERLLRRQGQVVGHAATYLNGNIYSGLSSVNSSSSLYAQLREAFGHVSIEARERYSPINCDVKLAPLLGVAVGSAIFKIERLATNIDNLTLEYSITHIQGTTLSLQLPTNQPASEGYWECIVNQN